MQAIALSFGTFLSTLSGGLFALHQRNKLHYIMSFAAGVLIGVCFFDIMPEVVDLTNSNHLQLTPALVAIVAGFLAFHILEKTIAIHSSHEMEYASHHHPTIGVMSASGLSFHSFLDGVGIGLGFQVSTQVGLLIAIAVIAHDFTDGLNTVTLVLANKNTIRRAAMFLVIDATTPILGVLSTFLFSIPQSVLQLYLGFFAGFLLYIGASDLLPEAHSDHSSYGMIILTVTGALFIFAVTRVT